MSDVYINSKSHLKWQCSYGHKWHTSFDNVKNGGRGCPECNRLSQMGSIEECYDFAESKNWECLSDVYINSKSHLKWRCKKEHKWNASFNNVKNAGSGCPECNRLSQMGSIEECHDFAESKNWECLSTEYINAHSHLKWRCKKEHEWNSSFDSVKNAGSGCPNCLHKSESMSRYIIEEEMGYKFPSTRPAFLEGLELDGYCPDLNMAFEYNGIQHYGYVPHFHRNCESDFLVQRERDIKKYKICREQGIELILIPHQFDHTNPDALKVFIIDALLAIS